MDTIPQAGLAILLCRQESTSGRPSHDSFLSHGAPHPRFALRIPGLAHLVSLSNAQAPDLITITGDLVDSSADGTRDMALLVLRRA
jgi:3',5'-cyclic AMP phosphodiesterase CpdA